MTTYTIPQPKIATYVVVGISHFGIQPSVSIEQQCKHCSIASSPPYHALYNALSRLSMEQNGSTRAV